MTLFIVLAAAMVLLAMLLVILPLLRGGAARAAADGDATLTVLSDKMRELQAQHARGTLSEAEFDQERLELERQALQVQAGSAGPGRSSVRGNWMTAGAFVILLPLLAVVVYRVVGTPAALNPAVMQAQTGQPHESSERAIAALEQRLAAQPDDVQGWVLLGRSYGQLERFDEAAAAYRKAVILDGDNPDLLIEYANVLAITRGRDLTGEPEQLIHHALDLNPDHLGALTFAGLVAFQRDDVPQALQYWHHLVALLPEDSDGRKRIEALIARTEAEQRGGPPAQGSAPAAATTAITGSVRLAPELAGQVQAGDTLYIFARAPEGPPMPLAAVRTQAAGWPVAFRLDDSSAMMENLALSNFSSVDIIARVSHQGSATAQPGDLEGAAERVAVGSQDVAITIDRVVPD